MNHSHALTVEHRDRRPTSTRTSRNRTNSPETPTPDIEQSANLSFDLALRCFCAQHTRLVDARAGVLEAAMLTDMRIEDARALRQRNMRDYHAMPIEFTTWAAARRYLPSHDSVTARFGCSRATAYRWLAALRRGRGIS